MSLVVLDTSAVAAVILGEADAEAYAAVMMRRAGELSMSTATWAELGIVIEARQGQTAFDDLTALLTRLTMTIELPTRPWLRSEHGGASAKAGIPPG